MIGTERYIGPARFDRSGGMQVSCVCVCVCTTNTSKFLNDVHVKNGNENPRVGYNVCILDEVKPFLLALS